VDGGVKPGCEGGGARALEDGGGGGKGTFASLYKEKSVLSTPGQHYRCYLLLGPEFSPRLGLMKYRFTACLTFRVLEGSVSHSLPDPGALGGP